MHTDKRELVAVDELTATFGDNDRLAALVANTVTQEGESTWFEGVLLLAVYAVLAITFFFA